MLMRRSEALFPLFLYVPMTCFSRLRMGCATAGQCRQGNDSAAAIGAWVFMIATFMFCSPPSVAQTALLSQQDQPIEVSFRPAYQWYEEGSASVQQGSVQLQSVVPLGQRWQVVGRFQMARAGADGAETMTGVDDLFVSVLHTRRIGASSIVVEVESQLPTGSDELTLPELQTLQRISRSVFDFHVPSFGHGVRVSPRLTLAFPLTEGVILGVGGSYAYRGAYRPFAAMENEYDPGDAWEVFGGLDLSLSPQSDVSVDVRYTRYGADTIGGRDRLESGDFTSIVGQYRYQWATEQLRVSAVYQNWGESTVFPFIVQTQETVISRRRQLNPSYSVAQAALQTLRWRDTPLSVYAEARQYGRTILNDTRTLFLLGVRPSFTISDRGEGIVLSPYVEGTAGDVTGIDVGIETKWRF